MTDPTGRAFISYQRGRSIEVGRLVNAFHDHGVPTWQDTNDLRSEPTADELRRILADPNTACAVPFITPEVEDSHTITKIELPCMLTRHEKNDGFFLQPIAAGGLDYAEAGRIAGSHLGIDDLGAWNIHRASSDPIDDAEAASVAERVLGRRIRQLHLSQPADMPITLRLFTRRAPGDELGWWVSLDWTPHFDGRLAAPGVWDHRLLPALRRTIETTAVQAPGRRIDASGHATLAATYALGAACPAPSGVLLRWHQTRPGTQEQWWSLQDSPEPCPAEITTHERNPSSQDLGVIVSVAQSAEEAVAASDGTVPPLRGAIRVKGPGDAPLDISSAGQAVDLARRLTATIHETRRQWRDIRRIHLFLAGPAGLAMLLGQLANGLGPVQTYEHLPDDAVGRYEPVALVCCE